MTFTICCDRHYHSLYQDWSYFAAPGPGFGCGRIDLTISWASAHKIPQLGTHTLTHPPPFVPNVTTVIALEGQSIAPLVTTPFCILLKIIIPFAYSLGILISMCCLRRTLVPVQRLQVHAQLMPKERPATVLLTAYLAYAWLMKYDYEVYSADRSWVTTKYLVFNIPPNNKDLQ